MEKKKNNTLIALRLPDDAVAKLKAMANADDRTISYIVRKLILQAVENDRDTAKTKRR